MEMLIVGLVLFLAVHSVRIVAPGWRERVIAERGGRVWRSGYAILSIIGFLLVLRGYGVARLDPVPVYEPPLALRHIALLLLLPVFPLLIAAYAPSRIRVWVGHPMLIATLLWAAAHLLANGTLADLFLFGGFGFWAAIDWASSVARPGGPAARVPASWRGDLIAVLGGLAVYALTVLWLHPLLIGVSPL